MSRREGRDSDSKRHRSSFNREPSPKRSRKDGKPATERVPTTTNWDVEDRTDRDQKHRRRLQDALPLEAPSAPDSKVDSVPEEKPIGHEGNKHFSDPTEVPRSRSYFQQHDERGNAGQIGRSSGRRAAMDRGWWRDSKDQHNERAANSTAIDDVHRTDDKFLAKREENIVWRHDKYEMVADPQPLARKRHAFREKKIPVDSDNTEKAVMEPEMLSHPDHRAIGSEKRENRGRHSHQLDRPERPSAGDRVPNRAEAQMGGFSSRDRYVGGARGGNYRGRDTFSGRQGHRSSGNHEERWAHDLFDEASNSPPRKTEEEQIAKVEALLAL
ncbi:hypothetical protein CFOL_v3_05855 [Cephalotus follicularis]|uniref:Btz domain-containing protein n=1 Tax=Cephalotus follicularis TaxID=3775 RepID=A0A1Q3B2T2_CEPFO|nr:hypothetical protein CFOL_v3_05855 [Cephalotus follicularis]